MLFQHDAGETTQSHAHDQDDGDEDDKDHQVVFSKLCYYNRFFPDRCHDDRFLRIYLRSVLLFVKPLLQLVNLPIQLSDSLSLCLHSLFHQIDENRVFLVHVSEFYLRVLLPFRHSFYEGFVQQLLFHESLGQCFLLGKKLLRLIVHNGFGLFDLYNQCLWLDLDQVFVGLCNLFVKQ